MKALLLGGTGLLGQAMALEGERRGWAIRSVARSAALLTVDISDERALTGLVQAEAPDIIINCSALTDIRRCEEDPGLAYRVNARPLAYLAAWSAGTRKVLLHISTDHFHVEGGGRAHDEDERPALVNEYARSKYAGEAFALTSPSALVLRTSIVGIRGWAAPTFAEWALQAVLEDQPVQLFHDAYTSSIDVGTFSKAALDLCERGVGGLLNVAAKEVYSKEDFVRELALQLERPLSAATRASVATLQPPRPSSLGLDVKRAEQRLGYELPELPSVIASVINQYRTRENRR